jgi:hypothetical protein
MVEQGCVTSLEKSYSSFGEFSTTPASVSRCSLSDVIAALRIAPRLRIP